MRTNVCLNWGSGRRWGLINLYEAFTNNEFFYCFQAQLVFLSMKELVENLFAAILILSNSNSLY